MLPGAHTRNCVFYKWKHNEFSTVLFILADIIIGQLTLHVLVIQHNIARGNTIPANNIRWLNARM